MSAWHRFLRRLRALFRSRRLDADMAEEMRFHLDECSADYEREGLSSEAACYAAQRKFGHVDSLQERCRDQRGFVWIEQLVQDFRYAARQMRRNPGFAATAIAVLALGIGATTTIFSVVHGIVLKPLPYAEPGQLVEVFEAPTPGARNYVSTGVFLDWREQASRFEDLAAYSGIARNFAGDGEPERIRGWRMTANGLRILRARPVLGRIFAPDEDQPGKDKVVVLTDQLWRRRFGGDPEIVGRSVRIDDENHTVIGVLPAGFLPYSGYEYVIPWTFDPRWRDQRSGHFLRVIGRLRPAVTIEQAHAELETIVARNKPAYPDWKQGWSSTLAPMQEHLVREIKPALLVLLGAVVLTLLVACANVANLLLARASVRQREIAVRAALGASGGRIVRQLLAESVLLAAAGGGLGLVLAFWSVQGLRHLLGTMGLARAHEVTLDGGVLGLALIVSLVTGVLFGLAPALRAARPDLNHALKDAARGSAAGGHRLRSSLVVAEVALALMLLTGAGLLLHSFVRLVNVSPGFDPARALSVQLTVSNQRYPDLAQRVAFYHRIAERVAALPGVEAAGLNASLPLDGQPSDMYFRIPGRANHPEPGYDADYDFCTADYFRAMGIPLLRGRFFTVAEGLGDARVAIINEAMARQYFPGEDPIGRHLGQGDDVVEIVGIVGDVRMRGLARDVDPMVYRPRWSADSWRTATLVVRTRQPVPGLADSIRQVVRALDPAQPVANVRTLDEVMAASVAQRRLILGLLGLFAGVALALAAVGLYGVIAYGVSQRTREFGIRLALGARPRDVLTLVFRHGLRLVGIGLVLGLAGALGLSGLLGALLYDVAPSDPLTFAVVSGLLLGIALLASWLPARRAARVDPMVALRCE